MYQILVIWAEDDSQSVTYSFKTEAEALAFHKSLDELEHHLDVAPFSVSKGSWITEHQPTDIHTRLVSLFAALCGCLWWGLLTSSQHPSEYLAIGLISGSIYYLGSLFLAKARSLL